MRADRSHCLEAELTPAGRRVRLSAASCRWKASFSASTSGRSLFRALHDPKALRANPAVSRFFVARDVGYGQDDDERATEAIRGEVLKLAERFRELDSRRGHREQAERRYRVIVRCDLSRESPAEVAAELGLSLRQVRREQKAARERIFGALLEERNSRAVSVAPDAVPVDVAVAVRLWDAGMFDAAIGVLQGIARHSPAIVHRIGALSTIAEVLVDRNDTDGAQAVLRSAENLLAAETGLDDRGRSFFSCILELARLSRDVRRDDSACEGRLDRVVETAVAAGRLRETPSGWADVLANALVKRASLHVSQGALTRAHADLTRLGSMLADGTVRLPSIAIDSVMLQGDLASLQSDCDRARAALQRALELSQEHGFRRRAAQAGMLLAEFEYQFGDRSAGIEYARNCTDNARRIGIPSLIAESAVTVASLEILEGQADAAQAHLDLAQRHVTVGSLTWARYTLVLATLRMLARDRSAALTTALAADRAAATLGSKRLRGATLRTIAAAELSLGRQVQASATIQRSLELLQDSGSRSSLAMAYNVSAIITGHRKHRAQALELFPNLPQSQLKALGAF